MRANDNDRAYEADSIGEATAADLLYGDPPEPLIPPFLTPEGATVLYGRGGVGKGLIACHFIQKLVESSHIVLLIDYEGHEREWGSRLRGLGMTDPQLRRVHYRAPFGPEWTAETGSLSAVADRLREEAYRLDATVSVVDSYSLATSSGDQLGGEASAKEYFSALQRIGLPSLTLAHVTGASERFPAKPFGSVFVHNLARETWAVESTRESNDSEAEALHLEHTISLELRNMKQNTRQRVGPQFIDFSFFGDNSIEVSREATANLSIADLAADILAATPNLTLKQLAAAIKEDTARTVSAETLRMTLCRYPARFVEDRTSRPHHWSMK